MLTAQLREALGAAVGGLRRARPVSGGGICRAFHLEGGAGDFFLKLHDRAHASMFEAEFAGLSELRACGAIRVPEPVAHGVAGGDSWLLMEYVRLGDGGGDAAMARLGERLAALHRCTANRFGWARDNTIGSTPQPNGWMDDWIAFWRERRLGFQLDLLARKGRASSRLLDAGARLCEALPAFFAGHAPEPSLLHGDLWGGNRGFAADGEPVIFDPAVYYGDREADLAMTALFGGFSAAFYDAYHASWSLDAGHEARRELYNLYHILNHANLFGGGYAAQAEGMIARLLAEAGVNG